MRAPLNSSPISPCRRVSAVLGLVAVATLLLAGCGDDGGDESTSADPTTETTTAAPSTTEAATTTSTEAPTETTASVPDEDDDDTGQTTEPTEGQLSPGDACSLEEGDPDCIDPDGDGEGVYLIGGAECAADAPDISICEDLDGDGHAGYPDEYDDLPTCSDEVPPPCNNPSGSSEEDG